LSQKKYKRRWGDRKDGRLLRSLSGFTKFIPFIMPVRNDALNYFEESFEISETDRWLRAQRVNGYKGLGYLHLLIAVYIRCIALFPGLNRFVNGRRIYARNDIEIVLTVKKTLELNAEETTIKVHFKPTDTIYDVYHKMNAAIDEIKTSDEDNGTEEFANAVAKLPRFILRFAILILKIMDYFGIIPRSLLEVSPFHGSMIITDLGSLGINPVYHHIYNFGNLPVFIAFGAKRKTFELDRRGQVVERKYIDCKVTTDERIADGHYFAVALKEFRHLVQHPEELAVPPETVVEDIF